MFITAFQQWSSRLSRLGRRSLCWLVLCGGVASPLLAQEPQGALAPEVESGRQASAATAIFDHDAVAAAHPLAVQAGRQMLAAGGSAVDAAIATQMVLGLVEPQSSGLGGGGFMLAYDGQAIDAFDGRETAPGGVDEGLFLNDQGQPLGFWEAVASGRSVGVPGLLRMLEMAHAAHGELAWSRLFEPAITLARQGFPVSERLHQSLDKDSLLREDPVAAGFYYRPDGSPLPVGSRLKNPALAEILHQIAQQGSRAFYRGSIADAMVARVAGNRKHPGKLSAADMAGYEAIRREALCTPWGEWRVCGFPPPSSGHLTLMQILGILDQAVAQGALAPRSDPRPSTAWLHHFLEASRLAFADRNRYIADDAFVAPPGGDWSKMLAPDYLARRAGLIHPEQSLGDHATPGVPGAVEPSLASAAPGHEHGTTHLSIMDAQGRAVAMTTSVEQAFGSRMLTDGGTGLAGGILLNNQLTDFSFRPEKDGRPIANRVEPGKRPRSSMSPTLVFDAQSGRLVASLGSPGGAAIIHYTASTLSALRDAGVSPQQAVELPHAVTFGGDVYLETGRFAAEQVKALGELGQVTVERTLTSGIQALEVNMDGRIQGGADPRREGAIGGDALDMESAP